MFSNGHAAGTLRGRNADPAMFSFRWGRESAAGLAENDVECELSGHGL